MAQYNRKSALHRFNNLGNRFWLIIHSQVYKDIKKQQFITWLHIILAVHKP